MVRSLLRISASVVVALAAALCLWTAYIYASSPDVPRLDRAIRDELPIGSSKATVVSFLERHHVQATDSEGATYYHGPRRVWGTVHEPGFPCARYTTFTFRFDEQDRLTAYDMQQHPVCL